MTIEDVIAALGMRLELGDPEREAFVGEPPDLASIRARDLVIVAESAVPEALVAALHEAVHLLVGPADLDDESMLMVVQQVLIREVEGAQATEAQQNFAEFMWDSRILGTSGWHFSDPAWLAVERKAQRAGFVTRRRGALVPVWGQGPSPKWQRFLRRSPIGVVSVRRRDPIA